MDERKRVPQNWKTYAAGLGACGLVASAAVTDGSVGSSPPEAVIRAVQSALYTQEASAGNSSSNSSNNSSSNSSSNSNSNSNSSKASARCR
jgi:hypothetical protein